MDKEFRNCYIRCSNGAERVELRKWLVNNGEYVSFLFENNNHINYLSIGYSIFDNKWDSYIDCACNITFAEFKNKYMEKTMRHKHCELIKQWAETGEQVWTLIDDKWIKIDRPAWTDTVEYYVGKIHPEVDTKPVIEGFRLVEIVTGCDGDLEVDVDGIKCALSTMIDIVEFAGYVYCHEDIKASSISSFQRMFKYEDSIRHLIRSPKSSVELILPNYVAFII